MRAVVDGDDHRQDVADLVGALVLEEAAGLVREQRVGLVGGGHDLGHRHVHRLVAGLRRGVGDGGQHGRLADRGEAGRWWSSRRGAR